jgi:hypothetical protein
MNTFGRLLNPRLLKTQGVAWAEVGEHLRRLLNPRLLKTQGVALG